MKPIHVVRKPRDWKNLHPASRVAVEERNCCDCIFSSPNQGVFPDKIYCNVNGKHMNAYDECGAFTRKQDQEKKE